MTAPLTPAEFQAATGVSRETLGGFQAYADLLNRWTQKINLVGESTRSDLWRRHFLDSAQLAPLIRPGARILDIGSGAGFPGLVLALLGLGPVTLVESDRRKATFLREAARATGAPVTVIADRIERVEAACDVVTARACAPLPRLLALVRHLLTVEVELLLLKGQDVEEELTEATRSWRLEVTRHPSRTDSRGVIVQLSHVQPR